MFIHDNVTYLTNLFFNRTNDFTEVYSYSSSDGTYHYTRSTAVSNPKNFDFSRILYTFDIIKDRCMENSYFLGSFINYFTNLGFTWASTNSSTDKGTITLGSSDSIYKPVNIDIKDYNSTDFKYFDNLMKSYKDSCIYKSTELKDWTYNSSIFIIPYMIYLFRGINFHVHDGDIEGFFKDSVCINGCINDSTICQILCASTKLMTYAANDKDALTVLYNQASAIETALASTANKDYMDCQTLSYNAFLTSSYLVKHTFYDKSTGQSYLLSTAGEVTVYDGPALILSITFGTDSSTLVGQFTTLTTTTKTKTYSATTEKILLFVDKLTLQNKGSGTVESITYIPLGDQPESTVLNT
jgi:hypothetical protein